MLETRGVVLLNLAKSRKSESSSELCPLSRMGSGLKTLFDGVDSGDATGMNAGSKSDGTSSSNDTRAGEELTPASNGLRGGEAD